MPSSSTKPWKWRQLLPWMADGWKPQFTSNNWLNGKTRVSRSEHIICQKAWVHDASKHLWPPPKWLINKLPQTCKYNMFITDCHVVSAWTWIDKNPRSMQFGSQEPLLVAQPHRIKAESDDYCIFVQLLRTMFGTVFYSLFMPRGRMMGDQGLWK